MQLKPGYFEDDRCWFKQAWTLQEIREDMVIGGETGDEETFEEDILVRFHEQLESLRKMRRSHLVFDVLSEMKNRMSTNCLDKVAGLGYILDLKYLPMYHSSQYEEDAWETLVNAMFWSSQATLLFLYPEPGNTIRCWCPSWKQIMTKTLPSCKRSLWDCSPAFGTNGYRRELWITDEDGSPDSYRGYQIDSGYVKGLSRPSYNDMPRQGVLVVKDNTGSTHTFKIVADHTYPTPKGSYTLLGSTDRRNLVGTSFEDHNRSLCFWVVGRQRRDGKFQKLSVFRMLNDDERRRIWNLKIVKYSEIDLC